jgi:hypothetical protein
MHAWRQWTMKQQWYGIFVKKAENNRNIDIWQTKKCLRYFEKHYLIHLPYGN